MLTDKLHILASSTLHGVRGKSQGFPCCTPPPLCRTLASTSPGKVSINSFPSLIAGQFCLHVQMRGSGQLRENLKFHLNNIFLFWIPTALLLALQNTFHKHIQHVASSSPQTQDTFLCHKRLIWCTYKLACILRQCHIYKEFCKV